MRARDAALHERPEPLDGLRVHVSAHVDPVVVVDRSWSLAAAPRRRGPSSVNTTAFWSTRRATWAMSVGFLLLGTTWAVTLPRRVTAEARRRSIASGCAQLPRTPASSSRPTTVSAGVPTSRQRAPMRHGPTARGLPPTYISSISTARQRRVVVLAHQFVADEGEHPPRRLVGHAQLALKLLGRNATTSAGHEVHGVEPQVQRRGRLVEDRPRCRVDVSDHSRAGPGLALLLASRSGGRPFRPRNVGQ